MKKYNHLNEKEREDIFLLLGRGKSLREVAKSIGRNHRTIGRELKRNSKKDRKTGDVSYSPSLAQNLYTKRRKESKTKKIETPWIRSYVIKGLGKRWSPEQIAGRLEMLVPSARISHELVYQFIYDKENRHFRLWEFLRKSHTKRQSMLSRKVRRAKFAPTVMAYRFRVFPNPCYTSCAIDRNWSK
ncbi:MAG: helix-turn-helix domain-containing protein [Patescibacteria group bacterium]